MRLSEGAARRRRIVGHLVSLPQRSGIRRMNPRRMSVDLIPWSQGHLFASQATPKEAGGPVAPEDGGEGGRRQSRFPREERFGQWPTCILAVMVPTLQSKCTQRTQRELKVKTTLLDLLAESEGTEARAGSESHGAREERARQQAMAMGQTPGPGAGRGGRHSLM